MFYLKGPPFRAIRQNWLLTLKQGVPVNEFNKWFRDTHKRIHPIQVSGVPTSETKQCASEDQAPSKESVRIAVTNSVFMEDSEKKQIYRIPASAEGGTRPDNS